MSMATIRLYIPSMIRTLNEIRFEQEEYILFDKSVGI